MSQYHTAAYVSLLAPGKTDLYRLPPKKDYHVYIARSTYHYAHARQTQVNWKNETKKRKEDSTIPRVKRGKLLPCTTKCAYGYEPLPVVLLLIFSFRLGYVDRVCDTSFFFAHPISYPISYFAFFLPPSPSLGLTQTRGH